MGPAGGIIVTPWPPGLRRTVREARAFEARVRDQAAAGVFADLQTGRFALRSVAAEARDYVAAFVGAIERAPVEERRDLAQAIVAELNWAEPDDPLASGRPVGGP